MKQPFIYKVASTEEEYEQIHQLNYATFVEEIPQHNRNESRKLTDQFHNENTYIIAKKEEEVIGMIAVRGDRPFSIDHKLPDIDKYLEEGSIPCEIRLLSVKKEYRKRTTFFGMIDQLASYCLKQKFNVALISGTERELVLYRKLGFEPFAHTVGTKEAPYQPMKLTKEKFVKATQAYHRILARYEPISFLSGPVPMEEDVAQSLSESTQSHRSDEFLELMKSVQSLLTEKTNATHASILVGTGTLANDVVAQQIKQLEGEGLILSNGEFGERLIDHATRAGLPFHTIQKEWNTAISMEDVRSVLDEHPTIRWIWTVHCETSTGYLCDLGALKESAADYDVHLCLDACSSLGVDDVDLHGVYLASSVSGKGLASYPGLAIVFHHHKPFPNSTIPRYLDLGLYASKKSTPFTHSSNALFALKKALVLGESKKADWMNLLRSELENQGWTAIGDKTYSNGIVTIALPSTLSSVTYGDRLKKQGILVNYESSYLQEQNWMQIALMGTVSHVNITRLLDAMNRLKENEQKRVSS
ncbi:aminotransferase class V-fold PLP-dependent enzyme [Halobacillus litoralis]|uniref:Aminotransferase class V-fold PLP-dependent enzyme n=1 Tax=Halobacillus litoralis TaxID=45668 RepID=A0A845E4W3_9BACI|nr:aminotransferase class V-fold PLP-dependent enzyme [Halobacillus litoralis]MYL49852.1 aminotransferase class V-fold PLP-dependent enzyme [Halobacillus litoralis]